ncbi:MAG: efflux RND transporter periplasmic adaptor subunit, partial [Victivallales bacterium]|nr:efflux RND transporter periplasmic adaptor subunit [Victivallales bacterium]
MNRLKVCQLLLILAASTLAGCGQENTKNNDVEQNLFRVRTQSAEQRTFCNRLKIHMNVKPVDHADICAKISGTIEAFPVREGMPVKQGDLLFQVDKFQLEANWEISRQQLEVLKSVYEQAQLRVKIALDQHKKSEGDFLRNQQLYASEAVSKALFDEFHLSFLESTNQVKLAEAASKYAEIEIAKGENNIRIAERRVHDSIIFAPYDGKIVETYMEQWEYAALGQKILKIESRKLELSALIPAEYYEKIITNKTMLSVSSKNSTYRATIPITYKALSVDPETRTFEIRAALPEDTNMISGMLCDADIILDQTEGYGLPTAAFITQANGKYAIFSNENGVACKRLLPPG